jgi:hypothetical protein
MYREDDWISQLYLKETMTSKSKKGRNIYPKELFCEHVKRYKMFMENKEKEKVSK